LFKLSLPQVLKRKNPYLLKSKYVLTAEQIVKNMVDAHISLNEETIFSDWLECDLLRKICLNKVTDYNIMSLILI